MKLSLILPLIAAVVLSGCASAPTTSLSSADRAAIKTIGVSPAVTLPPEMFYHGPGQSAAMVFGPIGGAIASQTAQGPAAQIVAKMKESNISVQEILKSEFARVASTNGFAVVDGAAPADANLTLSVNMYGLGQSHGFSDLYPIINVTAILKKNDGTIAWQKTDYALPANSENKESYTFDKYMSEPALLRKSMTTISAIVSKMLVNDLTAVK